MNFRTLTLVGALATFATSFATVPFAQAADDATYCKALTGKFRDFARSTQGDVVGAEAVASCEKGNTAAGIAVLERILTNNRITLPARS